MKILSLLRCNRCTELVAASVLIFIALFFLFDKEANSKIEDFERQAEIHAELAQTYNELSALTNQLTLLEKAQKRTTNKKEARAIKSDIKAITKKINKLKKKTYELSDEQLAHAQQTLKLF